MPSGQERLDLVLGGGLPSNGINLIMGLPGTGKTMLAEQFLFRNATPARPGLYLATASEPLEKLVRYGHGLSFFDASLIGTAVLFDDLGDTLQEQGLQAARDRLVDLIREHRPGILVIDSFKALQTYAQDPVAHRRFVSDLAGYASALPMDTFWVGEYDLDEVAGAPEFAIADSIIALRASQTAERVTRTLQIVKMRGSDYRSGSHAYRLTTDGLRVFPRLSDVGDPAAYVFGDERASTGVPGVDAMLGGGIWPGAATLVAGPSGSGKTLLGLHFLRAGAEAGEQGVYASLQENPSQIRRVSRGFGWTLDGRIELMYRSPVDVYADEWVHDLVDLVTMTGARRIVIDSLSDLRVAVPDPVRFHEYVYSLVQRCSRAGVSLLMTHEMHDLFGASSLMGSPISHVADNLVLLRYVVERDTLRRAITVVKSRASTHAPFVRRFDITSQGLVVD
jgi:circadian clock protein KaiC